MIHPILVFHRHCVYVRFQVAMGSHMAKLAGGWSEDLDRRRALQEALALF
jgi:hypothetical protein